MKPLFLFLFILIVSNANAQDSTINSQNNSLDSLLTRLKVESDRMKIETYLDIAELPIAQDSILHYLNKALLTAKKIDFDSIYPIQFAITVSNYIKGDLSRAKTEIRKGLQTYNYTNDPIATKGHIYMLLGVFSEAMNQIDSSKYYYDKTLKILEEQKSDKAQEITSVTFTNYGNLFLKDGNYEEAIKIYLKADKLSENIGDTRNRIISLNNIAGAFKEIKQYDKSLKYYNNALELSKSTKDIQNVGTTNIGVGEIYLLKNNNDLALKHFLNASNILEKIDFKSPLSAVYQNIAELYLNQDNLKQAEIYSNKAVNEIVNIKDDYTKTSVLITQSKVLNNKSNFEEAFKIIEEAVEIARSNKYANLEKEAIIKKIALLKVLKKDNSLSTDYERLIELKDSIFNIDKIKSLSIIETKYQTERKEKENLALKAENAEQALMTEKANTQKWLFALGALAVGIIAFLVWIRYKSEVRAKRTIQKQKDTIEILQKDLHHRVKNNLSVIDAFIEELKDDITDVGLSTKLSELQNRVLSINEVHAQLYKSTDITNIDVKKYVNSIAMNVASTFNRPEIRVEEKVSDNLKLNPSKSSLMGLIINEFITNSFKYAFDKEGEIVIQIDDKDNEIDMTLSDNGKGLSEDFNLEKVTSYGFRIMKLLTLQLEGTFEFKSDNGLKLHIEFPKI